MLASVLKSDRAVKMSIFIINTFVRIRQVLYAHKELAHKLEQLENRVSVHDKEIEELVCSIKELMSPPQEKPKKIGFLK